MNNENLIPFDSSQNRDEAKKNGKKGGKASGRSRRQKADMRQAMQDLLSNTYKQADGTEITGTNALVLTAMKQALDPDSKNWAKAFEYVMKLTGMDKAPEEMKMMLAKAMLIQAQAETIKKIGEKSDGKLLELLNGLRESNDLNTETEGANAPLAEEQAETT